MPKQFAPLTPKIVLAAAAHPDDLDFGAAGTLASFAAAGAAVHYLQLTDGAAGSADRSIDPRQLQLQRQQEQQAACDLIGGVSCTFLDYPDGHLELTDALKKDVVRVIRQLRPDVVITTDPTFTYNADMGFINHNDHRVAGQAVMDAVYPLARDHLAYKNLLDDGLEPHNVKTLLMTNFNERNFYVDISSQLETKLAAAGAHASQINNRMLELFQKHAAEAGKQAGYAFAEAFMRIDIN